MANVFQKYEEYRQELSEEEKELLNYAKDEEEKLLANETLERWEHGWVNSQGKRELFPVRDREVRIATERAEERLQYWDNARMIFPEDPEIVDKFPGIDPKGMFSEVDVSFSDRYAKLRGALCSRSQEVKDYVNTQLKALEGYKGEVGKCWMQVMNDSKKVRIQQLAAKMAPTPESSRYLEQEAENLMSNSVNIKRMNGLFHVMEYMTGLTDRRPTAQERNFMKNIGAELKPDIERRRNDELVVPENVQMVFANLDHQIQQKYFSNPVTWKKGPGYLPEDALSEEAVEKMIDQYANATADRVISPLFHRVEKTSFGVIHRDELITVDGKMVSDILDEKFDEVCKSGKLEKGMDRTSWLEANRSKMTNDIVSAGLMAGKRVEAFVPDKNGKIPKEPIQITKKGYEPSPLKKVTLNAWERHFAKHGYFKEKAAKAAEYNRVMESRNQVRARNEERQFQLTEPVAAGMKNLFFQGWVKDHGPLPDSAVNGISGTRSAYTTLATCAMLKEGYHIQEILDPKKMVEARDKICRETMDRLVAKDTKWAAEVCYQGHKALNKELDSLANFDITDAKELFSDKNRPFVFAAAVTFDLGQEMNHFKQEILEVAERDTPGRGKEAWDKVFEAGDSVASYVDFAKQAVKARSHYGENDEKKDLTAIARWEYLRGVYGEKRAANPGKPVTELSRTMEHYTVNLALLQNDTFKAFTEKVENEKGFGAGVRKAVLAGELGSYMKVGGFDAAKGSVRFQIETKQAQKTGNRSYGIQEAVEKNAAKEAEKEAKKQEKETQKTPQKQPSKGRR
ncbi:MAG: hypothetical protein HFH82_10805 [Lachnospiraceae bacterium]|nr:hypothetical protein [Lachnospiraceae bacterium]